MKYIGVSGHAGSGRKWFGAILSRMLEHTPATEEQYKEMVQDLRNIGKICSSDNIIFESFGNFIKDQAIMFSGGQLSVDYENSQEYYCINMKSFEIEEINEIVDLVDPEDYVPGTNCWMTLDNFFVYFGETIKKAFGQDVWVRSLDSWISNKPMNDSTTIIFTDVKTDDEVEYILQKGGTVFNLECPQRLKEQKYSKISKDHPFIDLVLNEHFENCWAQMQYALVAVK